MKRIRNDNPLVEFNGKKYKVQVKESGIYPEQLRRMLEQIHAMYQLYGRVLLTRFDLRSHAFDESNQKVSTYRKKVVRYIKRKYKTENVDFTWARENHGAPTQHYHCYIVIDGNKIRTPHNLLRRLKEMWELEEEDSPSNHLRPCESPYVFIKDEEAFAEAIHRISYLAKTRGKSSSNPKVKDFSTSRLKANKPQPVKVILIKQAIQAINTAMGTWTLWTPIKSKINATQTTIHNLKHYKHKTAQKTLSNLLEVALAIGWITCFTLLTIKAKKQVTYVTIKGVLKWKII